jgi:signal peptidase I
MYERDESLAVLTRTPPEIPEFHADLDLVVRRARSRRTRRFALQGSIGAVIAVGVLAPLLLLAGVIGGGSGRYLDGSGNPAQKLIRWYEPSGSMDPTIKMGETVLVDTNAYHSGRIQYPATGDLVLFKVTIHGQEFEMVKRVIGLPGQVIVIRAGVVFVDGRRLAEPYLNEQKDLADYGPFKVGGSRVFVAGDNRIDSNDSRHDMGQILIGAVIGKVVGRSPVPGTPPTAPAVPGPSPG